MMKRTMQSWGVILAAGLVSALLTAGEKITPPMRETLNRTDLSRQEIEARADALVEKGNVAYAEERYEDARQAYLDAAALFSRISSSNFQQKFAYCRKQIVNVYIAEAQEAIGKADTKAREKDYEEAIRLCKVALEKCPEYREKLNERIALYEKRRNAAAFDTNVSMESLMPDLKTQVYQIELLLEQGRKLAGKNEYSKALRKYQEVLLLNPYNAEALQGLKALYARIGKAGIGRQKEAHVRAIAEVDWKYAAPIAAEENGDSSRNLLAAAAVKKSDVTNPLEEKLDKLKIKWDEDTEDRSDLNNALGKFSERCLDNGINVIVLGLDKIRKAPAAAKTDNEGGEGEEGANANPEGETAENPAPKASNSSEEKSYTFNSNVSAKKNLDQICKMWNLVCIYEPHAIIIRPKNVAIEPMETRIFAVSAHDISLISGSDSDNPSSSELCKYFRENSAGNDQIEFPEGSRIMYDSKINRLIVTNTAENVNRIADMVNELVAIPTPMVQIQAKFVEISQNDLDELAFNYQYAINQNKAAGTTTDGLTRAVTTNASSNELMRYYRSDTNTNTDPLANSNFSFLWANNDGTFLRASVYALNYADSTDTLSSPRVTTLDRKKAHIKMVEKHIYPDEWETVDYQNDSTSSSGSTVLNVWNIKGSPDPQPTFDTDGAEELGISFEITPKVDTERRTIEAHVMLPINTFSGWQSFDSRTSNSGGDEDGEYFKKAIIDNRTIETDIVIYDGETIVLGGIAMDNVTKINDKIPILGDIPIIGRFFQSKYTKAEKRNILVFLTCRLVKPDGTAFYSSEKRSLGVPDFGKAL